MTDERESLIAAIAAEPDNDTLRLAFADWLQENGYETRAAFIRLQCDVAARCDEWTDWKDPSYIRAKELAQRHWPDWFGPLFQALAMPAPGPAVEPAGPRSTDPWTYGPYHRPWYTQA